MEIKQQFLDAIKSSCGAPLNLFDASAKDRLEKVQDIIVLEPDLGNSIVPDGFQPLGLAFFIGDEHVVRFLIAHTADVNSAAKNPTQVIPLHSAIAGQHLVIASELLAAGAQVNALQQGDFVPLHAVAQNGQPEMGKLLLSFCANPALKMTRE